MREHAATWHGGALVVVGAGGHGREVLDIVDALVAQGAPIALLGALDDSPAVAELLTRRGVELLGTTAQLASTEAAYVVGIGDGSTRRRVAETATDLVAATLVHPTATIGADNRLGSGVVVAAGAHVTTNVVLGVHTHCNVASVVSHDCRVGDYVTIAPGALVNGGSVLGDGCFIGTGAIILPGRHVGAGAVVGAGSVVDRDVPAGVVAKGVPARW